MVDQQARIRLAVWRYIGLAVVLWTAILAVSLWWNVDRQHDVTFELALNTARASFNKDQAYRFWASTHGGVYVEPSDKTPPSPWMSHLPDRDLITTEGRLLTLMNPAYMLREMMQDFGELYGIQGRIVGIVYLNPNNKADEWEADAIRRFAAHSAEEVLEVANIDGQPHLRFIKPMIMSESCQKCHGHLGFKNGEVRGAVGLAVPMAPYLAAEGRAVRAIAISHGGVWGLGLCGIGLIGRRATVRLMEKARADEETRLAAHVFGNALDATIITDPNGVILRANPTFRTLTGFDSDEVIGKTPRILRSHHHDEAFYRAMWKDIIEKGRWQGEIWNRRKDGSVFTAWESIVAVRGQAGEITYFIGSFSDITDMVEAQRRIQRLAHFDVLTDLPNRVLFHDRLAHALLHARRAEQSLGLMFLDLDGFKKINDTMGHRAGDELLKEVGTRLRQCIRASDTVARLGGDEFTVVIEQIVDQHDTVVVWEKVATALAQPITIAGRDVFIGASVGISMFPKDGDTAEDLLQHADTAMYEAKKEGKNCYRFYSADMTRKEQRRLELETALRQALDDGQLAVYYQPKQCVPSGRITGFEALVRWRHPELGIISPADFVPLAEEMRLIGRIDQFVLREACRQAATWTATGNPVSIAVNLSGLNLHADDLPERIAAVLAETGLPPEQLELELTESTVLDLGTGHRDVLLRLKELGVRLAIDDFGTGYSSLSYLKQLPVDTLKIDRSFIRDVARDGRDAMLVSTIIDLAHSLKVKVVAEGIEEVEQLAVLRDNECDEVQGYLIARPMPAEDATGFLGEAEGRMVAEV
ncbi:MAG: EAL domain-containing protein [Magnetospirillum sp.]|nr:EAL domain-containing protein [Magnetospirillum sp.]